MWRCRIPCDRMKVLLVEDEPGVQAYVSAILRGGGYEVEAVADGDEALRVYRNRKSDYDLVLTDRSHPGMDGIELAATIRKINPSQLIAFQTAGSTDSIVEQRIATHEVSDIPRIEKPFRSEQLLRFIKSVTEKILTKTDHNSTHDDSQ